MGKTTLMARHLTGEFRKRYVPTHGVEIQKLTLHTSAGPVVLRVWDVAGQETLEGLGSGYYVNADCAIVMFDVTNRISYEDARQRLQDLKSVCGDIPIVLVANKVDAENRQLKPSQIVLHRQLGLQYYEVSAKSGYNFEKPFLWLIRKLLDDAQLSLVGDRDRIPQAQLPGGLMAERAAQRLLHEASNIAVGSDADDDL